MKLTDLHLSQGRHLGISLHGVSCYRHMLFSTNLTVARKRVPEHVIMLKETFDKQDSIF